MRKATITRKTAETDISVDINLDGTGVYDNQTGVGFFDHMLDQLAPHGGITLHIDRIHGFNSHHIAEAAFKSVARALRVAVETDPRKADAIPSTKGAL